jgi:hypothetical protein
VILPQIQIARGHWLLGALFLAIILEEYLPVGWGVGTAGRGAPTGTRGFGTGTRSPSIVIPWALMLGGAGVWATCVFADVVHDMLVHFLWGDVLFAGGALELARRRGVYDRPWLIWVMPSVFLSCGALFMVHVVIDPGSQGVRWHLAMGLLLVVAGVFELIRLRLGRSPRVPLALLPLTAFAMALIAIPVAAAS